MWWHYKGNTFLETSFLPLPSVINVIFFFFLFTDYSRVCQSITLLLCLIFFAQPFFFFLFFFFKSVFFSNVCTIKSKGSYSVKTHSSFSLKIHILFRMTKFQLECQYRPNFATNKIVGLPILEQKIPITIEWYLKHWSCIVFEEIYGIRRKMTKREMELFWFFFFFLRNFWFGFMLMFTILVWFWIVLCLWYRGRWEEKELIGFL